MQRLAAVERLQTGKGLCILLNNVGQFQQAFGARLWRGLTPLSKGAIGRLHGGVHLRGAGFGNIEDHLPGRRVVDRLLFTFTCNQFTVDQ